MRKMCLALLMVLVLGLGARAGEFGGAEKRWLRQCMDALRSPSDDVRESAEAAIATLGLEAVPALVPLTAKLKEREHWDALGRALAGMGRHASAELLDAARDDWPTAHAESLAGLVSELREDRVAKPTPGPDAAQDRTAAQIVQRIVTEARRESVLHIPDPRIDEIIALGRPAVPALLEILRVEEDGPADNNSHVAIGFAVEALKKLARPSDLAVLEDLVIDGRTDAAIVLSVMGSEEAVAALARAVRLGEFDYKLGRAVSSYAARDPVRAALLSVLEGSATSPSYAGARAADLLARVWEERALEPLELALGSGGRGSHANEYADAAARLGSRTGVRTLIDMLESGPEGKAPGFGTAVDGDLPPEIAEALRRGREWTGREKRRLRHEAGVRLNRIFRKDWYTGRYGNGRDIEDANFDEAGTKYRAWWDTAGTSTRYDKDSRIWVE